jgi:segregation and condensation protein B
VTVRKKGREKAALEPEATADDRALPEETDQGSGDADAALAEDPADEAGERSTPFEEFAASWVPPWARLTPELVIEPAADNPPEPPLFSGRLRMDTLDMESLDMDTLDWPDRDVPAGPAAGEPSEAEEPPNPDDFEPGLADEELRGALEAILLVVDEPVTPLVLAQVLEEPTGRVEETLTRLAEEYVASGRGFELRHAAGGWRLYTRGQYAAYVERFVLDGQQVRLTQAALETLAVVAYKQPVTRSRISAIRGVNCDGVIKTLVNRGLVEEGGTEPESGAHLYRTTRLFLEKLGLNDVTELPSLAPFLPDNVDEIDFAQR